MKASARLSGLAPVGSPQPRLLILGTFPSPMSRQRQEYYGNPANRFWRLLSAVYGVDDIMGGEYGDKKKLGKEKPLSVNLIDLLPVQFLNGGKPEEDLYERILQVCEFVAGMTDSYAVMLYKRLQGIELPK